MTQKTVLCYGDSNTHGTRPMTRAGVLERFAREERWTGVLAHTLGASWRVIEEGLPARTTVHDDPIEGRHKNGLSYLRACLESHLPVDVVVLMLGTNDLKTRFAVTPADIATSVGVLLAEIAACDAGPSGASPTLVLMAPAPIVEVGFLGEIFAGGAAKSRQLAKRYEQVASDAGARFLDAGAIIEVSPVDGVHFEADQHRALGQRVAALLQQIA
ncbi:SGNH/GDSL hydrolase family protein [Burkholderia contaminans]|uniref:SGNH/GDSL hydrolase family protein n=1 Tax=Burkholderia contaminans TaxID=488447 RepID=UPI003D665D0A